jgi:hypothetical protein
MSITDKLLMFVIGLINKGLDKISNVGGYETTFAYFQGFVDLIDTAAYFLPLSCMMGCLISITTVHLLLTNVFVANWGVKRIRGG